MNPQQRTENLFHLLGWQGGTIHDACKEIGVEPHDFLHASADFDNNGPCADFRRGYEEAEDIALYLSSNRGNLQYWFGAISFINNAFAVTRAIEAKLKEKNS